MSFCEVIVVSTIPLPVRISASGLWRITMCNNKKNKKKRNSKWGWSVHFTVIRIIDVGF
uniref:Uncharacterized protein n=1 Tax=Nelumbo nucifera TaxID=4432 RepID=A0A822Z9U9_NELNU|nr:TPA_asm: hypothetical protein HUJ06_001294 [Nelumbo nucifera]